MVYQKFIPLKDIEIAKQSPSFDREYDLKYLGKVGNLYSVNYRYRMQLKGVRIMIQIQSINYQKNT